ncbi:MAG: hypothetical protein CMJ20_02395 [Phycisphaeraceae bacterium]|nr:hypothetical protein [Phycisphaeraceae bacterium]
MVEITERMIMEFDTATEAEQAAVIADYHATLGRAICQTCEEPKKPTAELMCETCGEPLELPAP